MSSSSSIKASQESQSSLSSSPPSNKKNDNIINILHSQKQTLFLFLSNPSTCTPVIVLYVASFGGALHAAVTTYFYLEIGASEMDIGHLGFIMSAGALLGAPICGMALDRYGPWRPISITAGACALGCLWRGLTNSLLSLRLGAILLGIGVNMFTVTLGHLVKSFPSSMRSEVLSGFAVQITIIQLLGKGIFPLVEYTLLHIAGLQNVLVRYRIHMGLCTFFCFYGVSALFWDRQNVKGDKSTNDTDGTVRYQHKHSDLSLSASSPHDITKEIESTATTISVSDYSQQHPTLVSDMESGDSFIDSKSNNTPSSSQFLNEEHPQSPSNNDNHESITISNLIVAEDVSKRRKASKQYTTTITLTFALLLQSIATTIMSVLWPLLAVDVFNLSAHTFGILTFISSVVATGAVASFPIIEKLEKIGGRVRCAAWGFGLGSILCILFCFCSFGGYLGGVEMGLIVESDTNGGVLVKNSDRYLLDEEYDAGDTVKHQLYSRKQLVLHAVSAIAFQATLCFLEPSLKSIISLTINSSSSASSKALGSTIGGMQSLGNIGGMVGNIAGTILYKVSKDSKEERLFVQGGSLPFVVTACFMAICSLLIWRLDEPVHLVSKSIEEYKAVPSDDDIESVHQHTAATTSNNKNNDEGVEDSENDDRSDGCCLILRETTYDLKLD